MLGIQENLIDFYGLQSEVRKLREAGLGVISIAKEISEKHLIPKGVKGISHGCVSRWCEANIPNNSSYDGRKKIEGTINVYNEYKDMLQTTQMLIDKLSAYVEELDSKVTEVDDITSHAKTVKELAFSVEKQISRKLVLVDKVMEVQEKVYNFMAVTTIVELIMNKVKERDLTLFADISADIKADPMLAEAYRRIKPSEK